MDTKLSRHLHSTGDYYYFLRDLLKTSSLPWDKHPGFQYDWTNDVSGIRSNFLINEEMM